ncbi:MAG TPA: zinc ribbon domain-containing protein [Anaerolineales bacterium]|nr:zinc ribbon domain-containing protein [Anaerolineales bacterium]HNN12474.1 zinc ribbon domain-containing protein [Anaerolineales bacterium]HNO32030.1 zinc ribbon domain-containing protein [Anaerolineales bacterium]
MRRFIAILLLGILFVFPTLVSAQSNTTFSNVTVELWPEYDQPSMLVIVSFQVASDTSLPVDLTFRIPQEANLIAVAAQTADGNLMNSNFEGPTSEGEFQVFTVPVTASTMYRFEYYQPLTFNGDQRLFSYLWDGAYAVGSFSVSVLEPVDTTSFSSEPALSVEQSGDLKTYVNKPVQLGSGEQFTLTMQYNKTTDTLANPPQGIQPSAPVDENTPGRVSLSNSLPYIIGGLGVVMIIGGVLYFLRSGRTSSKSRRRSHSHTEEGESESESYCPQCGTRAKSADRFCRTCGARLRHQEE